MLALSLLLSIPIARAADISPTWYVNNYTNTTSNRGFLNNSGDNYWWNGAYGEGDSKVNPSAMAVIGNNLYLSQGGGYGTTSITFKRAVASNGAGSTSHPLGGWSGGLYPFTYMFSLGDRLFATNFADANQVKLYEIPVAKIGNGVDNGSALTVTTVGTMKLPVVGGEVVGASGTLTNGRISFMNPEANGTTIHYFTVTNGNIDCSNVHSISLKNSDGSAYTVANPDHGRSRIMVKFLEDGSFFIDTNGSQPMYFNKDGVFQCKLNVPNAYGCVFDISTYKGQTFISVVDCTAANTDCYIHVYNITEGVAKAELVATCKTNFPNAIKDTSHVKQHISGQVSGNTLKLWVMQPNRGVAHFQVTLPEPTAAAEATDLKVSQVWNGDHQEATFTWTPGSGIDHYTLVRAKSTDGSEGTDISTNITGTANSFKYNSVQLGLGYQPLYILTSYDSNGAQVGNSCYVRQWDLDFGSVKLKAELNGTTATLSWNGPANGKVSEYQLIEYRRITSNSGATRVEEKVLNTYDANTHSATVNKFVFQKEENGETVHTSFYVKAIMTISITTKENEKRNYVISNTALPIEAGKPAITNIQVYEGRTTATLEWEFPDIPEHRYVKYYEVFRNGVRIQPAYESGKLSDMNLPDGKHTYYVIAHVFDRENDANEETTVSNTVTCNIKRNRLVTGYGLEVVYNYPIYTPEEHKAHGEPTDAVIADGVFANAKDKVGAYGAPGDAYRQAQFYNGEWYLACLTTKRAFWHEQTTNAQGTITQVAGTYIPNAWTDAECKKEWGDVKAGIIRIGARGGEGQEDPRALKTKAWADMQVNETWPLENQSVAISDDGRIYRRGLNGVATLSNQGTACHLFYLPWNYITRPAANGHAGKNDLNISGMNFYSHWTAQQRYRTHYISAGGNSANGTDYLLFAMNFSRDLYRFDANGDGTGRLFTAPKPADATNDDCTSTENYAFPVVGRGGDFIHQVRGEGLYYVNAATGEYTTVYSKNTDVSNSGGVTFKYNNEIFLLHPISTRSNNVGHFSIDMARKYNDNPDQASFAEMIPVAAFMQKGMSDFIAGNSNANWFGAEYNADEDCIYIYQYVPGVRFAKYRFYKYLDFPGVQPKLDIQVVESPKANGSGDEVELLTAVATWQRPNETPVTEGGDGYLPGDENTEYLIGEYEVEFLDNNNTPYSGNDWSKKLYADEPGDKYNGGDAKDKDFNTSIYYGYYGKDEQGNTTQKNLKAVSHTVRVTPIYHKKSNWDVTVRGEGNIAIASADYPAGINPLEVRAYDGTQYGRGYRVDFNFDRASMEKGQYPHHVSFFTLEVSKDGGNTFEKLTNYYFIWGNGYHSPSNENFEYVYDNYGRDFNDVVMKDGAKSYIVDLIPGDYRFGNNLGEEKLRDRYYYQKLNGTKNANALNKTFIAPDGTVMKECYKGYAAPDAKGECVAYYYTNENPQNYRYRAVAHYAAGNETIHKEVYTTAVAPLDMTTTGVDNIAGDNEGNLSIYPVPAESTVTINAPVGISNVKVFSLSGSLVLDVNGEGNNTQTIDVSMLTPGVYMVAVNSLTPVRMIKR